MFPIQSLTAHKKVINFFDYCKELPATCAGSSFVFLDLSNQNDVVSE